MTKKKARAIQFWAEAAGTDADDVQLVYALFDDGKVRWWDHLRKVWWDTNIPTEVEIDEE